MMTQSLSILGTPLTPEVKLGRAHMRILKHPKAFAIGAAVLLGESKVVDDVPTACTDGRDKFYGRGFIDPLTEAQMTYLVLHENLHVLKMDLHINKDLTARDPQVANAAMDYVINQTIEDLLADEMGTFIERPPGALIDAKFRGWSVREVFRFLTTGKDKENNDEGQPQRSGGQSGDGQQGDEQDDGQQSGGQPGDEQDDGQGDGEASVTIGGKKYSLGSMDKHDEPAGTDATPEEAQQAQQALAADIKAVIAQAQILAGMRGEPLPLSVTAGLASEVDWQAELADFMQSASRGDDDLTFRRYDRRLVLDDIYYPTVQTETMDTVLVCMDTSGSTYGPLLDSFIATFNRMVETTRPATIRILHWDWQVRADRVLQGSDSPEAIAEALKPVGGGGTLVSPVGDYIMEHGIKADCCLVFTDGYVESDPRWAVPESVMPTLWLVTENESFCPPVGRKVTVRA
jgi:predicted metal-dependent peptidase